MRNLNDDFKKFFPDIQFNLKDFQEKVISNVIGSGNTLCIMPTSGGKSVIYWMSALELGGTAIVVSPLTALIDEQAEKIEAQGYEVIKIHSGVSSQKQEKMLEDFAKGKTNPNFIFLSPEKMATDGYLEYCIKHRKDDIKLLVIDEVHCVSQWGMSFRPFYERIPEFMDEIFGDDSWCRILALTATLNNKEINDICNHFRIKKGDILKSDILIRNNIQLHVNKFNNEEEKTKKLWSIIHNHNDEKILVYVYRKYGHNSVESLCMEAVEDYGYNALYFHGDMDSNAKTEVIEKFRNGEVNIVFATNAFGMGIDISDIRVVIHFMIPESVEQYYQEVGRASRDNKSANAYLLYSDKNIGIKRTSFIDNSFPDENVLTETYQKLTNGKTGCQALSYFEDEDIQQCLPYYIKFGLVEIACKGFATMKLLESIEDTKLKKLYDSTVTKTFVRTINKSLQDEPVSPKELSVLVYDSVFFGRAKKNKPFEKWLILDIKNGEIDSYTMKNILDSIEEKKEYKHGLLDIFLAILENTNNSQELHQEIGKYLGTFKHNLALIHETVDGTRVRSKTEVIISNMLFEAGIEYKYEEKLFYAEDKWLEPDFTIYLTSGKKLYWEHLGMLGSEEYDNRWAQKKDIYDKYFPGMMVKTYESGVISTDVSLLIQDIKSGKYDNI